MTAALEWKPGGAGAEVTAQATDEVTAVCRGWVSGVRAGTRSDGQCSPPGSSREQKERRSRDHVRGRTATCVGWKLEAVGRPYGALRVALGDRGSHLRPSQGMSVRGSERYCARTRTDGTWNWLLWTVAVRGWVHRRQIGRQLESPRLTVRHSLPSVSAPAPGTENPGLQVLPASERAHLVPQRVRLLAGSTAFGNEPLYPGGRGLSFGEVANPILEVLEGRPREPSASDAHGRGLTSRASRAGDIVGARSRPGRKSVGALSSRDAPRSKAAERLSERKPGGLGSEEYGWATDGIPAVDRGVGRYHLLV